MGQLDLEFESLKAELLKTAMPRLSNGVAELLEALGDAISDGKITITESIYLITLLIKLLKKL